MKFAIAAAFAALASTAAVAQAAPAIAPPAHARPAESGPACLDNSRLVSHVAYTPDTSVPMKSCGHLLSTDAIVHDNRWNKT